MVTPLPPGTAPETVMGIGSNRILVEYSSGANFGLSSTDLDGTNRAFPQAAVATPTSTPQGVTEDGRYALVLRAAAAVLVDMRLGFNSIPLCVSGTCNQTFLLPGAKVAVRDGSGWTIYNQTLPTNPVALIGSASADLVGYVPGWVLLYFSINNHLVAYSVDGASSNLLSSNAKLQEIPSPIPQIDSPIFLPDLTVFWIDLNNSVHVARADFSIAPRQIEAATTYGLRPAGVAADGRIFYNAQHTPSKFDVMEWDPAAAQSMLIVSGAAGWSEVGRFVEK